MDAYDGIPTPTPVHSCPDIDTSGHQVKNGELTKASLPAIRVHRDRETNKRGRVFFDSLENGTRYYQVRVTWCGVKVSVEDEQCGQGLE